jgi:hypothetical protein
MKKLLLLFAMALLTSNAIAQDKLYLIFEYMQVDNEQEAAYMETEEFWQKIHDQRVKNGDIIGWDLWQLKPGGENQHFQYLTVNLYNDPVKMFEGAGDFEAAAKAAYPNMSEDEINKKLNASAKSRDLAVRIYLEQIDKTNEEYDIPIGTVAAINPMKVLPENFEKYEKMESEVFKPMHQKEVDNDKRKSWALLRLISPAPYASDTYASHITVDMYKDFKQYFAPGDNNGIELTEEQIKATEMRDLKYVFLATLIKKAR